MSRVREPVRRGHRRAGRFRAGEQSAKWVGRRPSLPKAGRVNCGKQRRLLPTGVVEADVTPPRRDLAGVQDFDRNAFAAAGTDQ
jgi:hypothetical protein